MPKRPPKKCAKQWCNSDAIDHSSYCEQHQPIRVDNRLPAHLRGYDSNWTEFRNMYLRQHPVCNRCGRVANVLHHVTPLEDGGDKYDKMNLESLCRPCHERHHGRLI